MRRIALYGASGFGREVLPLVRTQYGESADIAIIDDDPNLWGSFVLNTPIISFEQAVSDKRSVTIAIANQFIRSRILKKCQAHGLVSIDIRSPSFISYDSVEIEEGLIACDNVIFTSNIKIGKCFHANIYSYVAHDCIIGDFVTFAPRVSCNGNIHIQNHCYIGTGAIIKQGVPGKPLIIGEGAVVGMGAVVTKDVAAGTTVVGNPARALNVDR